MELTVLYRPVGRREYELIEATDFHRFPPRLPEQPFFYPVTNEDYATEYWIPAAELEEFNDQIDDPIECIACFRK